MISYEAKKRVPNESWTSFSRSYPNNYSFSQDILCVNMLKTG